MHVLDYERVMSKPESERRFELQRLKEDLDILASVKRPKMRFKIYLANKKVQFAKGRLEAAHE